MLVSAPSAPVQGSPVRRPVLLWGTCTLVFFALWILFVWPALRSPWWTLDEFIIPALRFSSGEIPLIIVRNIAFGRPLSLLWTSFRAGLYFALPSPVLAGLIMRLTQGALHAMAAATVAVLLRRFTGRTAALFTVLPFLLWPYSGESTYWTPAGLYPLAGLVSVCGVLLCLRGGAWRWIGSMAIACSVLIIQSGCFLGLLAFWLCGMAAWRTGAMRKLWKPFSFVLLGYVVGAGISLSLGLSFHQPMAEKTAPFAFVDVWNMVHLSLGLLISETQFYPHWLSILQWTIILLPIFVLAIETFESPSLAAASRSFLVLLFLYLALLVLPYLSLLATHINWLSGRLMYLSPLLFTASFCLLLLSRTPARISASAVLALIVLQLIGFFAPARTLAGEYVTAFRRDRETLQTLEQTGSAESLTEVAVATLPRRPALRDPYGLPHAWFGDSLVSAFIQEWSARFFVRLYSSALNFAGDDAVINSCVAACATATERRTSILLSPRRVLCFCA